jgi:hypothetical protein
MTGFLIVSPWRSGSTATAFAINDYCKTQSSNLKHAVIGTSTAIINKFNNGYVYHTHQIYNIKIMPTDFTLIINRRDMFDSTISGLVAEKLKSWTYFNNQISVTENINFVIDIEKFIAAYNHLKSFNTALTNVASTVPHYEINYNDIKDNLNNIFKICNLNYEITNTSDIPIKSNLDYPNIIPNYGELLNYAITQGWRT